MHKSLQTGAGADCYILLPTSDRRLRDYFLCDQLFLENRRQLRRPHWRIRSDAVVGCTAIYRFVDFSFVSYRRERFTHQNRTESPVSSTFSGFPNMSDVGSYCLRLASECPYALWSPAFSWLMDTFCWMNRGKRTLCMYGTTMWFCWFAFWRTFASVHLAFLWFRGRLLVNCCRQK